jgi:UDP-N-acetyl-D-glucosamine dehydrogenase
MVKLLENTFRSVNIGLVNELALMCHHLDVDVWEVIEAAASKPFGFMPFYPGPGLGGHCIPIDPLYLSWKARASGFEPRFIELAAHVNERMPEYVLELINSALNRQSKSIRDSRIHILGVAYKRGVSDCRESPALAVMKLLAERGAKLSYSDPYVPEVREEGLDLTSQAPRDVVTGCDCVVILTDHGDFDYAHVATAARSVVDARNAMRGVPGDHIIRL